MPRLTIPVDQDPMAYVWGTKASHVAHKAAAFSGAVYASETFSLRELEAARITIAEVNGCVVCLGWRSGTDVAGRAGQAEQAPEEFYEAVLAGRLEGLAPRSASPPTSPASSPSITMRSTTRCGTSCTLASATTRSSS